MGLQYLQWEIYTGKMFVSPNSKSIHWVDHAFHLFSGYSLLDNPLVLNINLNSGSLMTPPSFKNLAIIIRIWNHLKWACFNVFFEHEPTNILVLFKKSDVDKFEIHHFAAQLGSRSCWSRAFSTKAVRLKGLDLGSWWIFRCRSTKQMFQEV